MNNMKLTFLAFALISITAILSFGSISKNEVKITVTSSQPVEFDMLQGHKVVRGLKTPYEVTVYGDEKFLFKSRNQKGLDVRASNGTTVLTADWPVTVLLIEGDKLTTFGLN